MTEGTITFEENGFPVELVTNRDIERAIAAGRLRPASLVTQHLPGRGPITLRAAEVARLQPLLGLFPEESLPEIEIVDQEDILEPRQIAAEEQSTRAVDDEVFWSSPTPRARASSGVHEARRTPFGNASGSATDEYREPADFLTCAFSPLKRYAKFDGRSSRREFWGFALIGVIVFSVALLMAGLGSAETGGGFFVLAALALLIPSWAVSVRRLHDHGKTGWCVLLSFLPYVGWLIVLVLMCLPGQAGSNRYGPDPQRS